MAIKHTKRFEDLPTPRHTAVITDIESEKQTDRGVAIIGAAYIDLVLREAITARLLPDDKLIGDLFENRGPLQDFGARIQVTYALHGCGRAAFDDLKIIKDIRNAFAHSAEAIDFSRQDIARLCGNLWYPKTVSFTGRADPKTPREHYIRAIELLTELFHSDLQRRQQGMPGDNLLMAGGPAARPMARPAPASPHKG